MKAGLMRWGLVLSLLLSLPIWSSASGGDLASHSSPIAPVIFGATAILFFALIGRFCAVALEQPPVLGELVVGLILGNLAITFNYELVILLREGPALFDIFGLSMQGHSIEQAALQVLGPGDSSAAIQVLQSERAAETLQVAHVVDVFARYGALFLMFYVGLETSLNDLREVGLESIRVAITGVAAPFLLGIATIWLLLPELPTGAQIFVAATLAATSVGITASVLEDMGRQHSHEARVILGAAVIDDVLALLLLAIVTAMVVAGVPTLGETVLVIFRALAFLLALVVAGPQILNLYIHSAKRLKLIDDKFVVAIIFAMSLAWVADFVGLAPIVGAFAAGVIIEDAHFHHWNPEERRTYRLRDLVMPLEMVLVPFFFVLMGIQVKLESFLNWQIVQISVALLVVAVIGKLLSGLGANRNTNRWAIGVGMLPRGEVGLVFAAIGRAFGVIGDALFSAIVLMVMLTTLAAPLLLKRAFSRQT